VTAQVMLMQWRHLIRKPAKLTGTRRELCIWGGGLPEPGVGSLSRKRYTPSTLNTQPEGATAGVTETTAHYDEW
jgi:hypothetical protein